MRCGCALMLVLLLSFLVSVAAKPSTKVDRILREKRKTCDKSCEWKNEPERQICVYKCISPLCYEEVYMPDELEEGEIDVRAGRFNICYRREFKEKESQAEMSEKETTSSQGQT